TVGANMSVQGCFMGEHGGFYKRLMDDESFRTPMMMRYPVVVKAWTQSAHLLINLDMAPTFMYISCISVPEAIQGESFLPLLTDKTARGRDAIYYHYYENGEHAVSPHFGVKTDRYKLIRFYKRVESWELFDLKKDPQEMSNLYGSKKYRKIQEELKVKLKGLIGQYEDKDAAGILEKE